MPKVIIAITAPDLVAVNSGGRHTILVFRTQIWVLSVCMKGGSAFSVSSILSLFCSHLVLRTLCLVFLHLRYSPQRTRIALWTF